MKNNIRKNIQFYIIQNGSFLSPEAQRVRAKIYEAWHPLWTEIIKNHGGTTLPSFQGFRNLEILHCLMVDDEVVGFSAHRFVDCEEVLSRQHEYAQILGEENLRKLQDLHVHKIMTFEGLFVPPTQRKSQTPLPISKMLFYLANQTFSLSPADGMVGAPRIEVKVPRLSDALGYEMIDTHRLVRGIPCKIVVQRNRDIFHPSEEAWKLAQDLWKNRVVFRCEDPLVQTRPEQNKKAA